MTAAAWTVTLLVLAGCAVYARTALRGHQGGAGCLRRTAAFRTTRAVLVAAIWAARRVRAERGRP